jgi:hypothetical protein
MLCGWSKNMVLGAWETSRCDSRSQPEWRFCFCCALCVWACVWADVGSMRFHAYCFTSLYLLRIRCGVAMGFGCRPHGCLRPIGDRDRFGMGRSARTVFPGFGVVQMQFHKSVEMRSWSPCAVHASLQCILRVVLARSLWIFLNSR